MSGKKDIQSWWVILLTAIVPIFSLTCLFLGMRGLLGLGGFVASGGPYAIAHPAPGWIWIMFVSFPVVLISMLYFLLTIDDRGGPDLLMPLLWPITFISLGWNFLEYALFRSDRVIWGWLICGVVFLAMGGLPLALVPKGVLESFRANTRTVLLQLAGCIIAIPLGVLFFQLIT